MLVVSAPPVNECLSQAAEITISGEGGAEEKVDEDSGACHQMFRTRAQAEAFIEDWKQSFAHVYLAKIMEALDRGLRPLDMKLSVADVLKKTDAAATDDLDELKLKNLSIKEEYQGEM